MGSKVVTHQTGLLSFLSFPPGIYEAKGRPRAKAARELSCDGIHRLLEHYQGS